LTDIFATLAEVIDYDLPHDAAEDSISILPVLRGESESPSPRSWLLQQTMSGRHLSIRNGAWKYLDHRGSGGNNYRQERLRPYRLPESAPDTPAQLYNLEDDPGETKNLYFEHPEIVKRMKAKLDSFRENGRGAPKRQ
jgi:arylsulfatase A-like enzyme